MKYYLFFLILAVLISPYLQSQPPRLIIQNKHNAPVVQVAYSYNGQWIASSSEENDIKIWHAQTGKLYKTLKNRHQPAKALIFHPYSNLLISSSGNQIFVWNINQGKIVDILDGHTGEIYALDFSHDGNFLVSGGQDEKLIVWNFRKRRKKKVIKERLFYSNSIYSVKFSRDGRYVFSAGEDIHIKMWRWRRKKLVKRFRLHKYRVNALAVSPDNTMLASASNDHSIKVWNIGTGQEIVTLQGTKAPVQNIFFHPRRERIIASYYKSFSDSSQYLRQDHIQGHISMWDINRAKIIWDTPRNGGILSMAICPNNTTFLTSDSENRITEFTIDRGKVVRTLGVSTQINSSEYIPKSNQLLIAGNGGNVKILDLDQGTVCRVLQSNFNQKATAVGYDEQNNRIAVAQGGIVEIWEFDNNKSQYRKINTFRTDEGEIKSLSFTEAGKSILLWRSKHFNRFLVEKLEAYREGVIPEELRNFGDSSFVELWNPIKGERRYVFNSFESKRIAFAKHPQYEIAAYSDPNDQIVQCDLKTYRQTQMVAHQSKNLRSNLLSEATANLSMKKLKRRQIKKIIEEDKNKDKMPIWAVAFSNDSRYVAYAGLFNHVKVRDLKNDSSFVVGQFDKPVSNLKFLPESNKLISMSQNMAKIWNLETGRTMHKFQTQDPISNCFVNLQKHQFITVEQTGVITLWGMESQRVIARIINVGTSDYVTFNGDYYYSASKNGTRGVALLYDMQPNPLENFGLKYNRPDKIMETMGTASSEEIKKLRRNYRLRLKKLGFTEADLEESDHIPRIDIVNANQLGKLSSRRFIEFEVRATDIEFDIERLNVTVNNVPVYGKYGLNLAKDKSDIIRREVKVELSTGANMIRVSCINAKGVESLKDSMLIYYRGGKSKSDLYVIAISASQFQNSPEKQELALQDARQLVEHFSQDSSKFENIYVDTLFNRQAVKENILQLQEKLEKSDVDDKVIVFVSGKGLTTQNNECLFATYDVDFENPDERAVSYDDFENLLDNIPARNKLLLVDICPDTPEVEKTDSQRHQQTGDPLIKGNDSNFLLKQRLYPNLYPPTGTAVISAPPKNDKNESRFAKTILQGLQDKGADQNNNGVITISELVNYIQKQNQSGQSSEITTKASLSNDFRVW